MSWNATAKQNCRMLATLNLSGKPAKRAIFFPAKEALCLKSAVKSGLVDYWTRLHLIEKDRYTHTMQIENVHEFRNQQSEPSIDLENDGWTRFHNVNFDTHAPLHAINGSKKHNERQEDEKVDYAFFDFCGLLTQKRQEIIERIEFADKATICFTLNIHNRFLDILETYPNCGDVSQFPKTIKNKKWLGKNPNAGTTDYEMDASTYQICMVMRLFSEWNIEVDSAIEYQNKGMKHPMLFLKLEISK